MNAMSTDRISEIRDEAILWHVRLRDGDVALWEDFTIWLEADPQHSAAYDEVSIADHGLEMVALPLPALLPVATNENDEARPNRQLLRSILGGAVAASLVTVGLFTFTSRPIASQRYEVATGAGEHRMLALADGTKIALNGATRLTLDHRDGRFAQLESGEAVFTVKHDPLHPFTLHLGDTEVRDVGTVFNVVREQNETDVQVREGRVIFDPDHNAINLGAGQAVRSVVGATLPIIYARPVETIGSWQSGRLIYRSDGLDIVARDISRNLGVIVVADPALATQRFSGTVMVDHNKQRFFNRLGALLGVKVKKDGTAWRMSAS